MPKSAIVQARIDAQTKSRAKEILDRLNISLSKAISLYLRQIVYCRGIPFRIRIPNKLTAETLSKSEQGRGLHKVSSADELLAELDD
jgi:DNA-damage-inducible protein J